MTLTARLDRLEAALIAAASAGGPASRTKADYGPAGDSKKGGGRKVASKAGEKRYGLPIGTPLGKGNKTLAKSTEISKSYDNFMAAKTPAELNKAASWMGNTDLKQAAVALFSFDSKNERDEAGRIALVKELADRGIDPKSVGYKGGPVTLNPNPKQDPTERAAQTAQRKAETAARKVESDAKKIESDAKKVVTDAERAARATEDAAKKSTKDATTAAEQKARQALAQAIAEGAITETEARRRLKTG